jgi:hypothetical protein
MAEKGVPGWADLLIYPQATPPAPDPKRLAQAAENVRLPIVCGMSAVGAALAAAATSEVGIEQEHVAAIGWLMEKLGELADRLSSIHDEADFLAAKQRIRAA